MQTRERWISSICTGLKSSCIQVILIQLQVLRVVDMRANKRERAQAIKIALHTSFKQCSHAVRVKTGWIA